MTGRLTHRLVAARTGLSFSMVSRLRSGSRDAGYQSMKKIERGYGWPLSEQIELRNSGQWNRTFENVIREFHARVKQE